MSAPDVEYAAGYARLETLLRSIERPGDFCTYGRRLASMPRPEVEGAGDCEAPDLIAPAARAGHLYARTLDAADVIKHDSDSRVSAPAGSAQIPAQAGGSGVLIGRDGGAATGGFGG